MSDLVKFNDTSKVAKYALLDVATLVKSGIISGSGKKLNPNESTSRAESAVMLYRVYNKY